MYTEMGRISLLYYAGTMRVNKTTVLVGQRVVLVPYRYV